MSALQSWPTIDMDAATKLKVPFHRPSIGDEEINEVVATLRSGWLTTGPRTKRFETEFAEFVGTKHAIALNSATAALHLALEAIGLQKGESVLVPTMTFAATAEVVRYFDAKPILVDCCENDFNIDCDHAREVAQLAVRRGEKLRAIIPVHFGGRIANVAEIWKLSREFGLTVIDDAAHCCPAFYRDHKEHPWKSVGDGSAVSCFSFYANKCITTGEGGMACTNEDRLAERMRTMSLHGISKDAWKRFTSEGSWYYEIMAPGFKYNLTDIAAAIGIHQLAKAEKFRESREAIAELYRKKLGHIDALTLPSEDVNRIQSWHLFVIRLRLEAISIDRAAVIEALKQIGIGTSVHWMPLHMHPYYRQAYGYMENDLPVSARLFKEIISLPIYPGMTENDVSAVSDGIMAILAQYGKH